MSTLVIENVDFKLLSVQRMDLAAVDRSLLTEFQQEAIEGLVNMLEHWYDEIYPVEQLDEETPGGVNHERL